MPHPTMPHTPERELELIDDMLLEWHATDASKAAARYTLAAFARYLATRDTTLAAATTTDCLDWLNQRGQEVKPVTVAKNWSELRAFYTTAEGDDIADPLDGRRSPMARIKMPRHPKYARTHVATPDEVVALIRQIDRKTGIGLRDATMISLMFRSGLRSCEVARASLADLDQEARTIFLGYTKNDEPRIVPIHPETLALLNRYLRRRTDYPGPLFISTGPRKRSDRLPAEAIQTIVKRLAAKAAVPVTCHALRRGFVVDYIVHGGDIPTLMIIGGWSSELMIVRYMGERRALTAQAVFDQVAARQVAARRPLRAV